MPFFFLRRSDSPRQPVDLPDWWLRRIVPLDHKLAFFRQALIDTFWMAIALVKVQKGNAARLKPVKFRIP